MDPEDLRDIMQDYHNCLVETSRRHDGFVAARSLANPVLICFGFPGAHEDDAERAVRCGLELIAEVKALASSLPCRPGLGLQRASLWSAARRALESLESTMLSARRRTWQRACKASRNRTV